MLIFSEKGNKQAGEVVLDVAQFLNLKLKEQRLEKSLEKCPDKNAKLTFVLKGYLKEEIEADTISQKSNKTYDMDAIINAPNEVPNFKKKKDSSVDKSVSLDKSKKLAERQIPPAPKVSIERTKLLE